MYFSSCAFITKQAKTTSLKAVEARYVSEIENIARVIYTVSNFRVLGSTRSDGAQVSRLNNLNKNEALVKTSSKPGKLHGHSKLANDLILFLVYPFKIRSKRTKTSNFEVQVVRE